MKKKIKDLTNEEITSICLKARTNKKGKVKDWCTDFNCPLYHFDMKMCNIVVRLNQEIEVEEDE